ncbi:hypothetical protein RUM44_007224 [Polyplax serrata]|uniref:Protein FAN n=1 Tax=Polyplax serrata TaxID=468196 RepID=A0ABR1B040_POLSC
MERTRFSLLLLEPGEIYFEDFSASLFPFNVKQENFEVFRQLGRIKLCSKSLVFDPQDSNQPILKIPLQDCLHINRGKRSWTSEEDNVIQIQCSSHIEMLQGNVIAAYKFKQGKTTFSFLLNYAKVDDCLSQILQLYRASTLPPPEQSSMLAAIVFSKQSRVSFDTKWLEDIYEKVIVETQAKKIAPLVVNPGRLVLTSSRIYFQPYNNIDSYPVFKIDLKNITRIICRRFLLKQVGIEIFFKARFGSDETNHFYVAMKCKEERDKFYEAILNQPSLSLMMVEPEIMTLKWQNKAISNYEYLLYLNSLADRSFNDLTQYPVFPWVLSNYISETLDLTDTNVYRDLKKPIGALNEERLLRLKERTLEMPEPKFLYGSHYSAPGFVIFYLVRKFPHYMLCLQNGRFDHPDRMFNSVADVWRNVMGNMSDFKELIPEFYDTSQSGDFLMNTYGINFGYRCDGSKVHDVALPPWAENAADFVSKLRQALESDYVSNNLHHWIDLIFGYKQRGDEAKKANNIFYYLCYEGAVDIDTVQDYNEKHALEVQIMEFGQVPKQIFKIPHPPRLQPQPQVSLKDSAITDTQEKAQYCLENVANMTRVTELGHHKDIVTSLVISNSNEFILSGSKDSTVKMFATGSQKQIRSFNLESVGISSCILLPDDNIIVAGTFDDQMYVVAFLDYPKNYARVDCWSLTNVPVIQKVMSGGLTSPSEFLSRPIVYDIKFNKVIDSIVAHEDTVTCLCWGSVSRCLVSASWDCTLKVWHNIFENEKWHRLKIGSAVRFDFDSRIMCCSINRDNALAAVGTEDGDLIVVNISTNSTVLKRTAHKSAVGGVSFSPEARKLITCGWDGSFKVYDLSTGMEVYSKTFQARLTCLAWDGLTLILGSNSGRLFLWDFLEVKQLKEIKCRGNSVCCVCVSNNGRMLITGEDKMVVMRT